MSNSLSTIVGTLTKEDMELANKLYKLNGINSDQIDTLSKKNIFSSTPVDAKRFSETTTKP